MLKLFQCFASRLTKSETISATERVAKLFQNYFGDIEHVEIYSRAAISLWNNFEIIYEAFS